MIETFLDEKGLVCLNDGSNTWIDVVRGHESARDLTMVTKTMADKCSWEVLSGNSTGGDHFPISITEGLEVERVNEVREGKWILGKADWNKFRELSDYGLLSVNRSQRVESLCIDISSSIVVAAEAAIPKTKPKCINKIVLK